MTATSTLSPQTMPTLGTDYGSAVSVSFGDGHGGFSGETEYPVGNEPFGLALKDLNGDGNPDLIVVNQGDSKTISVLMGNADGTFAAQTEYTLGTNDNVFLNVADFNDDGTLDIVTRSVAENHVAFLYGKGDGTFQSVGMEFSPALLQGGSYYVASGTLDNGTTWTHFDSGSLTAADFQLVAGDGPAHPDFSATAAPIRFGFATSNTSPISSANGGVDNWSVTITPKLNPDVTVRVDDGRGGFDTQSYTIDVASLSDVDLTVSGVDQKCAGLRRPAIDGLWRDLGDDPEPGIAIRARSL